MQWLSRILTKLGLLLRTNRARQIETAQDSKSDDISVSNDSSFTSPNTRIVGINIIRNVSADNIDITQIYAPGGTGIEEERFERIDSAPAFSAGWLLYHQENIPFLFREDELLKLHHFLEAGTRFSWWCIVGDGGVGKSRLALEFFRRLPAGWEGGFVAKDKVAPSHASSWTAKANTLWIVDYAAAYGENLSRFVSIIARRFADSPFLVRLLLIERTFDDENGWWANLTNTLDREQGLIRKTLFASPLELPVFGVRAFEFAIAVAEALKLDSAQMFGSPNERSESIQLSIAQSTHNGNVLYVLLLIAELRVGAGKDLHSRQVCDVAQAFLARELVGLRRQANKFGLDYGRLVHLLFITTSSYRVPIPASNDRVAALLRSDHQEGDRILFISDSDGNYRLPTCREMIVMGIDIYSKYTEAYSLLQSGTNIDDLNKYLVALNDAGYSENRGWALQPDLLGELLAQVILRTVHSQGSLEAERPPYDADRVAALVITCYRLNLIGTVAFWARMPATAILAITTAMARADQTPRLILIVLKQINNSRGKKLDLKFGAILDERLFPKTNDANAILNFVNDVMELISNHEFMVKDKSYIIKSTHSWALHFIDELSTLDIAKRVRLAYLISKKNDVIFFTRFTNSFNFLSTIKNTFASLFEHGFRGSPDWDLNSHEIARSAASFVLDQAANFGKCDTVEPSDWSVLCNAAQRVTSSIMNIKDIAPNERGIFELSLKLCDLSEHISGALNNEYSLEVSRRQRAFISSMLSERITDAWPLFEKNLRSYVGRAIDEHFEFILADYCYLACRTCDIKRFAALASDYLPFAVENGFLLSEFEETFRLFVDEVLIKNAGLVVREEELESLLVSFGMLLRDKEALINEFDHLIEVIAILFLNNGQTTIISRVYSLFSDWIDQQKCSAAFINLLLRRYCIIYSMVYTLKLCLEECGFSANCNLLNGHSLISALDGLDDKQRAQVNSIAITSVSIKDGAGILHRYNHYSISITSQESEATTQNSGISTINEDAYADICRIINKNVGLTQEKSDLSGA